MAAPASAHVLPLCPTSPSTTARALHTLLIHQSFTTPDDAGGTRHFELMRNAASDGHRFTVVASDFGYLSARRHAGGVFGRPETIDGISVLRVATTPSLHRGKLGQLAAFLSFMTTSFAAALRVRDVDVVMATTPPIFQTATALAIATLRRKPLLLEIRDLWPEFIIDMGQLTNPIVIRAARWFERFLYRHADHFVVNSPAYVGYLEGKGVASERISLIPNGADPAMFATSDRPEVRAAARARVRTELDVADKFVVTYAGAMGPANDVGTLLRAAAALRDRREIHFLLIGGGKARKQIEAQAAAMNLENVTFTGPQPKSRMSECLAATDLCVATLRNIAMFRMTYPNKVFDYMAAGRPIALAIDGVVREVVEAASAGVFTPPEDSAALARTIAELAAEPERCAEMGRRGQAYVREHFDRARHAEAFAALLRELGAPHTTRAI